MSLGYPTTKNDIDSRAGGLAIDLRQRFRDAQNFKVWLDAEVDADLTARGYTSNDIARLRSAAADMDKLAQIYFGTLNLPAVYDFRTFTKFLTGVA
jgi:hypothetical protein